MTALLLIGLLPGQGAPRPAAGPHRLIPAGEVTALALEVDARPAAAEDEAARLLDWADRQNRVLLGYVADMDVLPVALGAVFSSTEALEAHLAAERAAIAQGFAEIAACCEYILQVRAEAPELGPVPASETSQTGAAFLAAKRGRRAARQGQTAGRRGFLRALEQDLAQATRAHLVRDVAGQPLLADLSLLVERQAAADLVARLSARAGESDTLGLAMRLIGPAPAYSFISERARDVRHTP